MAHPLGRGVVVTIADRDQWQEVFHVVHQSYSIIHVHECSVDLSSITNPMPWGKPSHCLLRQI